MLPVIRSFVILGTFLGVVLATGSVSASENKIHVKNCSSSAYFTMYFYDGGDRIEEVPSNAVKLAPGKTGTGKCARGLFSNSKCFFKVENTKKGKLGSDIWDAIKTLGTTARKVKNKQWVTIDPKSDKLISIDDSEPACS
jgi:hypothetical protein